MICSVLYCEICVDGLSQTLDSSPFLLRLTHPPPYYTSPSQIKPHHRTSLITGYAANFILSVFDRDWRPDMTEAEGMDVIKKCIHELHTRFLISQPNFVVKIVDQAGTRVVKL